MERNKNCANCKYNLTLEVWDYTKTNLGVPKVKMPGFVCTAFANEGIAVHMYGVDPEKEVCEMLCYENELRDVDESKEN